MTNQTAEQTIRERYAAAISRYERAERANADLLAALENALYHLENNGDVGHVAAEGILHNAIARARGED